MPSNYYHLNKMSIVHIQSKNFFLFFFTKDKFLYLITPKYSKTTTIYNNTEVLFGPVSDQPSLMIPKCHVTILLTAQKSSLNFSY